MDEKGDADGGVGGGATTAGTLLGGETTPGATTTATTTTAQTTTTPATTSSIAIPENWKEALPEDIRTDPNLKPIHDITGLVKSYIHAQKMIGRDKVQLPDKHATDDDWVQFYQKIGQPKTLEEYQIEVPKDAKFEDGFISQLKEVAFKSGILPRQINPLINWYAKINQETIDGLMTKQKQESEQNLLALKKEWGEAFNQKLQMAKQAIKATNIENINSWLDETGLGDDPKLIKILATLGEMMKEDSIVDASGQTVSTPQDLQTEINEIMGNLKHPYYDGNHPNHKQAVAHVAGLFERLHPKREDQGVRFGLT